MGNFGCDYRTDREGTVVPSRHMKPNRDLGKLVAALKQLRLSRYSRTNMRDKRSRIQAIKRGLTSYDKRGILRASKQGVGGREDASPHEQQKEDQWKYIKKKKAQSSRSK